MSFFPSFALNLFPAASHMMMKLFTRELKCLLSNTTEIDQRTDITLCAAATARLIYSSLFVETQAASQSK